MDAGRNGGKLPRPHASVEASANIDEAIDGYLDFIDELIDEGEWPPRDLLTFIPGLSLFVQHWDRDFFLPYFLVDHFFQLETICSEFSIPLPPPPGKRQYRERLYYYAEICRSLHEFRISHGLSPEEMAAFLYDFAPRVAPGFFAEGELPAPINVQLVITFKEQAEKIQEKQAPILIQGNERTQPGDIILTYSISPKKSIISIARAVSKGFFDPFSYYPQQIWIGSPRPIPPLHLKQMRENEILGGKSIIKKNM